MVAAMARPYAGPSGPGGLEDLLPCGSARVFPVSVFMFLGVLARCPEMRTEIKIKITITIKGWHSIGR
jgi:hypothetical protein